MNKGEKLICLNTIRHYQTNKVRFRQGEFYAIIEVDDYGFKIKPEDGSSEKLVCVSLIEGKPYYSKNFLTLAAYRDRQIDQILNDE